MKEPKMPPEAEREFSEAQDRFVDAFIVLVRRWPNFSEDFAVALLGNAIAVADMFGVDVEGFLAHLRKQNPKPPPLVRNGKASS